METLRSLWLPVHGWLEHHWLVVKTAVGYYASTRVIFYTEVALIMLCCMDLMQNATLLTILVTRRGNYAFMYTGWAVDEKSYINANSWDEGLTLAMGLFILESIIRIYYCLKLAYYHNLKVAQGDLCCMKCHKVLMLAAMSGVFSVPHFLSGLFIIVFFITCHAETATRTVNFHKDYFAHSPFIGLALNRSSSVMGQSMFYKMAEHIVATLSECRFNSSVSNEASTEALLHTGQLLSIVRLDCAVERMHCRHGKYYLQLAIESTQVLINYTVIRCLFSHVIHMHQYEVYNLQTRLQTRGSSRLIRVYRLSRKKTQRRGRLSAMPRQALMSLIHIGSNVAARFRMSRESRSTSELPMEALNDPGSLTNDSLAEQDLMSMATDSDGDTCSVGNESDRTIDEADEPGNEDASQAAGRPRPPAQHQQQQQQQPVHNRKNANTRKVDYEHLKVSNLYPAELDNRENVEAAAAAGAEAEAGAEAIEATPVRSLTPVTEASSLTRVTPAVTAAVSSPAVVRAIRRGDAGRGGSTSGSVRSAKKVNNSIFTDETFYSLDT